MWWFLGEETTGLASVAGGDEAVTVGITWRRGPEGKQRGVTGGAPGGIKYASMAAFNSRVRGSEGDGSASVAEGENEGGRVALRFSSPRVEGAWQAVAAPGRASGGRRR
jgi:hypothetical protein